jgi:hypothetical protein
VRPERAITVHPTASPAAMRWYDSCYIYAIRRALLDSGGKDMSKVTQMIQQDQDVLVSLNLWERAETEALGAGDEFRAARNRKLVNRQVSLLAERYHCPVWEIIEAASRVAEAGPSDADDDLGWIETALLAPGHPGQLL